MPQDTHEQRTREVLSRFQGKRAWQLCILGSAFTLLFVVRYFQVSLAKMVKDGAVAYDNDFRVFWAAGKLALESRITEIFDNDSLNAVHQIDPNAWMPWLYPPGYLIFVTPFGTVSFGVAWIIFSLISITAVALALKPFTGQAKPLWVGCVFAPAFATALVIGQNSLLWVSGIAAAIWALRSGKDYRAGFFIGLLTLKPQLGLLIPLALLAIGAWRTILAATITAILVAVIPTLIYGVEYWTLLGENMSRHSVKVQENIATLPHLVSIFSMLTQLGVSLSDALIVQWVFAAIGAVIVFLTWRAKSVSLDVKAAVLLAATLISVPYVWYYEAALFIPMGLFMLRGDVLKFNPPGIFFMFVLWIGTLPIILAIYYGVADSLTARNSVLPIVIGALALSIRKAMSSGPAQETQHQPVNQ